MSDKSEVYLVSLILLVSLFANAYGIIWGLPSRWNVDEPVATTLRMMGEKTLMPVNDPMHPTLHYFFLMAFFLPLLMVLRLFNYPLEDVIAAGQISWIHLSLKHPDFATMVYVIARLSSCILGTATVFMTYKIGKRIFGSRVGLLSAGFLAITMGFVGVCHTAKSTSLVLFLSTLAVYLGLKALDNHNFKKYFCLSAFVAGLSLSTKYSGGILLLPLGVMFLISKHKAGYLFHLSVIRHAVLGVGAYVSGILIGMPAIVVHSHHFWRGLMAYEQRYTSSGGDFLSAFLSRLAGYGEVLSNTFGLPLFVFVFIGLFYVGIKHFREAPVKIILSLVIPYLLTMSWFSRPPTTKYVILVVPFLCIFAGRIAYNLLTSARMPRVFSVAGLVFTLSFSLVYTLDMDFIYSHKDLRYESTAWIKKNVPPGGRFIVYDQPEWSISLDLVRDYEIITLTGYKSSSQNRYYMGLEQHLLSQAEIDSIVTDIAEPEREKVYAIFPFHEIKKEDLYNENFIACRFSDNFDLVKVFERQASFFWNPNIGGYEPDKILIYKRVMKTPKRYGDPKISRNAGCRI
jgi:hypothetical protein